MRRFGFLYVAPREPRHRSDCSENASLYKSLILQSELLSPRGSLVIGFAEF